MAEEEADWETESETEAVEEEQPKEVPTAKPKPDISPSVSAVVHKADETTFSITLDSHTSTGKSPRPRKPVNDSSTEHKASPARDPKEKGASKFRSDDKHSRPPRAAAVPIQETVKVRDEQKEREIDERIRRIREGNVEAEQLFQLKKKEEELERQAQQDLIQARKAQKIQAIGPKKAEDYQKKRQDNIQKEEEHQKAIADWEESVKEKPKESSESSGSSGGREMKFSRRGRGSAHASSAASSSKEERPVSSRVKHEGSRPQRHDDRDVAPALTADQIEKNRQWQAERKKIDDDRIARHSRASADGNRQWVRVWDQPEHKVQDQ